MTVLRHDGAPDLRYGHSNGMRVMGTKVDHFAPAWSCAICKVGWKVPHTFHGSWHGVKKAA